MTERATSAHDQDICCDKCKVKESALDHELLLCSRCELVYYCSQSCQKAAYKSHKAICRLSAMLPAPDSDTIKLDSEEILDFSTALQYAQTFMKPTNLKHVSLVIHQHNVLDTESFFGEAALEKFVELSPEALKSMLEATSVNGRSLDSVSFIVDDCCWDYTRRMTSEGKAWLPLCNHSDLKSFHVRNAVFQEPLDLTQILTARHETLKVLFLDYLTLGSSNEPAAVWSSSHTQLLVSAIAACTGLIKLSVDYCFFRDEHIQKLVSGLCHLRVLSLTGNFGDHLPGGYLTDTAYRIIADHCPNIQALDLQFHRNASSAGVAYVVEKCRHLRELSTSARFPWNGRTNEYKRLFELSDTLLLFSIDVMPGNERAKQMLAEAAEATGGRILITTPYEGLLKFPSLSASSQQQAERTERLVENLPKYSDPSVYNEWETFF